MCTAHGKRLNNWLRNDGVWELFETFALEMELEIRCSKTSNSAFTRVSESFPELIQKKAGSPDNGGGTWIHPLLALQLAQYVDKKFAYQVTAYLAKWLSQQKSA